MGDAVVVVSIIQKSKEIKEPHIRERSEERVTVEVPRRFECIGCNSERLKAVLFYLREIRTGSTAHTSAASYDSYPCRKETTTPLQIRS